MGDALLKVKSLEVLVTNAAATSVSNAAVVRLIASANTLITVANNGVNVRSVTVLGGNEAYITKYPADTIMANNATGANATSIAFEGR